MADASFFNNIKDLVIEGGSFNFNVQHTQVVKFAFSTGRHDTVILQGADSQRLYLLLAKAKQLIGVLPQAHLELARHFAGRSRQHTTANNLRDHTISVGLPLFTCSLFPALPSAVRFMILYFLVAVVVVDILHPMRLERTRPSNLVKVLDALGKYHDFPWAACKDLTTFHAEFVKRSRNQPGFFFIKSKRYELEYNGRTIMQQEDWKAIQPFTDIFVDFFLIQGAAPAVKCPWCKSENLLPSSYEESTSAMCSCIHCDRDFGVMNSLQAEPENLQVIDATNCAHAVKNVDLEILRLRVRIQPSKNNTFSNSPPVRNLGRQTVVMSWIMDQSLEQILVNYVRVVDRGHPRHKQVGFIPRRARISELDTVRYYHVEFEDGSDRMSQNQLQQVEYQAG